jgi:hypothetical protein
LSAREFRFNMPGMNLVLKTPDAAPGEAGRDLNVLILGEDSVLAAKARKVLEQLAFNLKADGRLITQCWDFDVLTFDALREVAAAEAAAADIILIGNRDGRALPGQVAAWMRRWLHLRKDRPGALVAVMGPGLKMRPRSRGMISQLNAAAATGGLDFFITGVREERNNGMKRRRAMTPGNPSPGVWIIPTAHGLPGGGWRGRWTLCGPCR